MSFLFQGQIKEMALFLLNVSSSLYTGVFLRSQITSCSLPNILSENPLYPTGPSATAMPALTMFTPLLQIEL